jgi:hypothetical protein
MKRFVVTLLVLAGAFATGCGDDPVQPKEQDTKAYRSLENRSDVLFNFQKAYNDRKLARYDELLDAGFIFMPSDADVNGGGLPAQWDRAPEMASHARMFDPDGSPGFPKTVRIEMDVRFEEGVTWTPIVPQSAPEETWHTAAVFYDYTIEVEPDTKYIPTAGAKFQVTVRNAGTAESPSWRLVELRDLGASNLKGVAIAAATVETTLGKVKALFR